MTASPASDLGTLTYASPDVRTSPPRTVLRVAGAAIAWCFGLLLAALRLCVVGLGYAVLATGIALRFVFSVVAMILLFLGGLRWEVVKGRTLRAADWVDVRVLNTVGFFRHHLLPRPRSDGAAR